jgi:hypothetical protein
VDEDWLGPEALAGAEVVVDEPESAEVPDVDSDFDSDFGESEDDEPDEPDASLERLSVR